MKVSYPKENNAQRGWFCYLGCMEGLMEEVSAFSHCLLAFSSMSQGSC